MSDRDEFKDELISSIVKQGQVKLRNPTFNDRIIEKITAEAAHQDLVKTQLKASIRFLSCALVCLLSLVLIIALSKTSGHLDIRIAIATLLLIAHLAGATSLVKYRKFVAGYSG